ncbi:MAG: tryptophan 7-halogenase [Thermoanaerobaculia bacterium]|nr:tryptophan 7-halogenase [Thermoanaerobaculia bacterium]
MSGVDGGRGPRRGGQRADVVILGAGLAGLTLARQLLLETDATVVALERRPEVPGPRQKVGESTVQLAGYYLSKVLDLEEHLLTRHFMKYNLRFYWPGAGGPGTAYEEYSQSYIREISNVASYQLDRNAFERELVRVNGESPRFELVPSVRGIDVELGGDGDHTVRYRAGGEERVVRARWVVDATGRVGHLARRLSLRRPHKIRHGAFFWWVDGLVDIERLTGRSRTESRRCPGRRELGHLPVWLATNHFVTEGAWFWVIPLHGKTSLGIVYDRETVPQEEVFSVEKATRWVCERFPLFARDLPHRRVLDRGGFKDFSLDSTRTISAERWATTGEAGRFSDPLYSPGSDLIAVYNTVIVDAIKTGDRDELASKCAAYEQLMRVVFAAYEPSYAVSYDALGDQETFSLKYVWELAVYFAFYVFPFLNDLLTERRFLPAYLRAFARLGRLNLSIQRLLSGYFQWKKRRGTAGAPAERRLFDFASVGPLAKARETFYEVGGDVGEARRVIAEQLDNLEELARYVAAWVASAVLEDPALVTDRRFVEALDPESLQFDPEELRRLRDEIGAAGGSGEAYPWRFDPLALEPLRPTPSAAPPAAEPPAVPATLGEHP